MQPPIKHHAQPRVLFLGALYSWSHAWLATCLWLTTIIVVILDWRWASLVVLLWVLGQSGLVLLTRRDPYWDERLIAHLLGKPYPSTTGDE